MQSALDATGRKIVLSIEGGPNISAVSAGGAGSKIVILSRFACCPSLANPKSITISDLRRVGTDIKETWYSMIGLVDTGSGLWPFAHNATSSAGDGGGFWNDLDVGAALPCLSVIV